MREWCGCGAAIRARRKDVIAWRTTHWHQGQAEPEPEKQGSFSQNEHAGRRSYEHGESSEGHDFPIVYARMGFNPNPQREDGDGQRTFGRLGRVHQHAP